MALLETLDCLNSRLRLTAEKRARARPPSPAAPDFGCGGSGAPCHQITEKSQKNRSPSHTHET